MDIKKPFSPKLFFVLLGTTLIPLVLVFFYLHKNVRLLLTQFDSFYMVFVVLFFLAIALSIVGTLLVSRPQYERFLKYNMIARKIAGGKFELRLPVDSDDELGKLGKFFNLLAKEHHEIKKKGVGEKLFEREKIQAILENIGDGVIMTDNFNKIELLNSVAEAWFVKEENRHSKQKITDLIQDEKLLELIENVKEGKSQKDEKVEIQIKSPDDSKSIVLQAIATKVVGDNNRVLGVATALRDLTKEKEIDKKKTEVVSMVSHELRSPLTSIAGFSELLLNDGISKEQLKDYAEIILSESRRLNDLINKYLDISRIESGKSEMNKTAVNMEDVIRSVVGMNGFLAETKGIGVNVEIPKDISLIHADRQMMSEVILNLFSNAVKYSSPSTNITIKVYHTEKEQIVEVIDQGYGIPEKALENVFDKFFRVSENEKVQEEEGTGLGLSLVKEIIIKHKGRIWAKSKLNEGSTFFVALPKLMDNELVDDSINDVLVV
ncbi:hypothetical protein B6I21_03530 [candidate division KSB1 bacterium 4572_119]|nr:MAG: hypothetical protein B6I21_03530 [candidate division KSB1 bacterium 4572_119]